MAHPADAPVTVPSGHEVLVEGLRDVVIRTARCCQPLPGDRAQGFVTRGRGVSVHRWGCGALGRTALRSGTDRIVEVSWAPTGERYPVTLTLRAHDRPGLAADVATCVSSLGAPLRRMEFRLEGAGARATLELDLVSTEALETALHALARLPGVRTVERSPLPE